MVVRDRRHRCSASTGVLDFRQRFDVFWTWRIGGGSTACTVLADRCSCLTARSGVSPSLRSDVFGMNMVIKMSARLLHKVSRRETRPVVMLHSQEPNPPRRYQPVPQSRRSPMSQRHRDSEMSMLPRQERRAHAHSERHRIHVELQSVAQGVSSGVPPEDLHEPGSAWKPMHHHDAEVAKSKLAKRNRTKRHWKTKM